MIRDAFLPGGITYIQVHKPEFIVHQAKNGLAFCERIELIFPEPAIRDEIRIELRDCFIRIER